MQIYVEIFLFGECQQLDHSGPVAASDPISRVFGDFDGDLGLPFGEVRVILRSTKIAFVAAAYSVCFVVFPIARLDVALRSASHARIWLCSRGLIRDDIFDIIICTRIRAHGWRARYSIVGSVCKGSAFSPFGYARLTYFKSEWKDGTVIPFLQFEPDLVGWQQEFGSGAEETFKTLRSSTLISLGATFVSTTLGTLAGYGLARLKCGIGNRNLVSCFLSQRF